MDSIWEAWLSFSYICLPCYNDFDGNTIPLVQSSLLHQYVSSLTSHELKLPLRVPIYVSVFLFPDSFLRTASDIPEITVPKDLFMSTAVCLTSAYNCVLRTFGHVAFGKDTRAFLSVLKLSSWVCLLNGTESNANWILHSWHEKLICRRLQSCGFSLLLEDGTVSWVSFTEVGITLLHCVKVYLNKADSLLFGAAFWISMTVPLLYECLEDTVDSFAEKAQIEIKKQYAVLDEMVLQNLKKKVMSYKSSKQQ